MSANFNPYVQAWRVGNNGSSSYRALGDPPSIFGALPMTSGGAAATAARAGNQHQGQGHSSVSDPNAIILHITDFRPNVLNASVVDARGRQCYKIVTDTPQQPQRTVFYDSHRRTVAIVDWASSRPSVEMPGLLPRQVLRSWLQTGPDRASRLMEIRGIPHIWVPDGEFICLYYANHTNSQRLARICLTHDAVRIELSQHAMEARLADACILSASIFLSGFKID